MPTIKAKQSRMDKTRKQVNARNYKQSALDHIENPRKEHKQHFNIAEEIRLHNQKFIRSMF